MDIIKLPIEYEKDIVDSRFRLVLAVAQRSRQLTEGSQPLVKSKYVKNITVALQEAIEGKLKYLTGDEARRAREFEYRMRRERLAHESMEEAAATSLEKMEDIKEAYKAEAIAISEHDEAEIEAVDEDETFDEEAEDYED